MVKTKAFSSLLNVSYFIGRGRKRRGGQGKHLDSVGIFAFFLFKEDKITKNKGRDLGKSPNLCLLFTGKRSKSLFPSAAQQTSQTLEQCNNCTHLVSALNHCLTNNEVQENKQEPKLHGKIIHLSL